jgi:arylsulfatase
MDTRNLLTSKSRRAATIASMLIILSLVLSWLPVTRRVAYASAESVAQSNKKPNILVIFGDDIGVTNVSAYGLGMVGYRTPNIDRIAREGMMFTD